GYLHRIPGAVRGGQAIPKRVKTTELDAARGTKPASAQRTPGSGSSVTVARGAPKAPARRGANGGEAPPDRKGHTRVGAKDGAHEPATLVTAQAQELTAEERALLGDLLAAIAEHSLHSPPAV